MELCLWGFSRGDFRLKEIDIRNRKLESSDKRRDLES